MHGNSYKIIMVFLVVLLGQMCLELKYVWELYLKKKNVEYLYLISGPSIIWV